MRTRRENIRPPRIFSPAGHSALPADLRAVAPLDDCLDGPDGFFVHAVLLLLIKIPSCKINESVYNVDMEHIVVGFIPLNGV